MHGVNKVSLIGNLGADPIIRYSQSGAPIANLRLAIGERRKDGDGWKDHTEWVSVTAFGKTAENVGQYLSKGSQVYVEGRLQTREYQDKEGNKRKATEVVAHDVVFLGGKGDAKPGPKSKPREGAVPTEDDGGFYDDSLPF